MLRSRFRPWWTGHGLLFSSVHPETNNFRMELSAVSDQQSAKTLFLMSFAESRKLARRPYGGLMADSANPKTSVSG
jgi:hypothetical protein